MELCFFWLHVLSRHLPDDTACFELSCCKLEDGSAEKAKDVQVIFISVDPQRDTADKLAEYMAYF